MRNVLKLVHLFRNGQDYNLLSHLSQLERKLKFNTSLLPSAVYDRVSMGVRLSHLN